VAKIVPKTASNRKPVVKKRSRTVRRNKTTRNRREVSSPQSCTDSLTVGENDGGSSSSATNGVGREEGLQRVKTCVSIQTQTTLGDGDVTEMGLDGGQQASEEESSHVRDQCCQTLIDEDTNVTTMSQEVQMNSNSNSEVEPKGEVTESTMEISNSANDTALSAQEMKDSNTKNNPLKVVSQGSADDISMFEHDSEQTSGATGSQVMKNFMAKLPETDKNSSTSLNALDELKMRNQLKKENQTHLQSPIVENPNDSDSTLMSGVVEEDSDIEVFDPTTIKITNVQQDKFGEACATRHRNLIKEHLSIWESNGLKEDKLLHLKEYDRLPSPQKDIKTPKNISQSTQEIKAQKKGESEKPKEKDKEQSDSKLISSDNAPPYGDLMPSRPNFSPLNENAVLLKYHPTNSVNITIDIRKSDWSRLAPETFLNDSLLEFYLKFIQYELVASEEYRKRIHIFSPFFFSKICKLNLRNSDEENYKVIARWTRKVDIFEKDFLVIPINKEEHWSLAIIAYPGKLFDGFERKELTPANNRKQTDSQNELKTPDKTDQSSQDTRRQTQSGEKSDISLTNFASIIRVDSQEVCESLERVNSTFSFDSPKDAFLEEQDDHPISTLFGQTKKEKIEEYLSSLPQEPAIYYLDSLVSSYFPESTKLRKYLNIEWIKRKSPEYKVRKFEEGITEHNKAYPLYSEINHQRLPLIKVKVPIQTDTSDCGLFMLQNVEMFLDDPLSLLTQKRYQNSVLLRNWYPVQVVTDKRKELKNLILLLRKKCSMKQILRAKLDFLRSLSMHQLSTDSTSDRRESLMSNSSRESDRRRSFYKSPSFKESVSNERESNRRGVSGGREALTVLSRRLNPMESTQSLEPARKKQKVDEEKKVDEK